MRWPALVIVCTGCAGQPFELDGAAPQASAMVDAGDELETSVLDVGRPSEDASPAGDAASEITPPVSDGGAGDDGSRDAQVRDALAAEASAPAMCCVGAGQASCSAAVECFGPSSSCSAMLVYAPDGGQYQTATCTGTPSPCSEGCAAGSACLWAGTEPGQWLPGSLQACR